MPFILSDLDQAKMQLEYECMASLSETNAHIAAGWISRQEARGLLGWQMARKVSLGITGTLEEIEQTLRSMRSARLNAEKKRLARETGDPKLSDRYNKDFVRNRVLPDMVRRLAAGETGEDILEDLQSANLSSATMNLIDEGLKTLAAS